MAEDKGMLKLTAGVTAIIASFWGGVETADHRYVMSQVYQTNHQAIEKQFEEIDQQFSEMAYSAIKTEIREIRKEMAKTSDPGRLAQLQIDLNDALGRLCRAYPEDRECN